MIIAKRRNLALPLEEQERQEQQANAALAEGILDSMSAKILYLDKWFAATPIVAYLEKEAQQPTILANPILGAECSFHLLRRLRATTPSRNPALRFFLLSLGVFLL